MTPRPDWHTRFRERQWKLRVKPRHAVRVAIVLTAASFWALAVVLYGPKRSLVAASAWFVMLAIKDATNVRVRAGSEHLHGWARWRWPLIADLGVLAARVALIGMAMLGYGQLAHGGPVVASLATLGWAVLLWPREALLRVAMRSGVGGATTAASLLRNIVGLGTMAAMRWAGFDSTVAVPAALLAREAMAVLVLWTAVLLSRTHGLKLSRGFDDEDGIDMIAVAGAPDRTVTPLRGFILDNYAWSRWRTVQYFSRQAAGGVLGPLGNLVVRIGWVFRTPKLASDLPAPKPGWRRWATIGGSLVLVGVIVAAAEHFGFLPALQLAGIAYAARFVGLVANTSVWNALKRSDIR